MKQILCTDMHPSKINREFSTLIHSFTQMIQTHTHEKKKQYSSALAISKAGTVPITYQKYSIAADTDVCWLLQSYKWNCIQEGTVGFECFPSSLELQFMDVRNQISDFIFLIIFFRFLYSEASEKSQTKWSLQQLQNSLISQTSSYIHAVIWARFSRCCVLDCLFLPHDQCNGVGKAIQPGTCRSTSADTKKPQLVAVTAVTCNGSWFPRTSERHMAWKWLKGPYFSRIPSHQPSLLGPLVACTTYSSTDSVRAHTGVRAGRETAPGWCKDGLKLHFHHPLWGLPITAWPKLGVWAAVPTYRLFPETPHIKCKAM